MGIASVFFVWTSYSRGFAIVTKTLVEHMAIIVDYYVFNWMFLGEIIFCVGAALSLATTFGGIIQSIGLGAFLWEYREWSETSSTVQAETGLGIGVFIGAVSTGIVIFSMLKPVGIGYGQKGFLSAGERLKVVCTTASAGKRSSSGRSDRMASAFKLIASDKRWRVLLVCSTLISVAFAAGVSYQRSTFEPVDEIPGGVEWRMGDGVIGFMGEKTYKIIVNDSVQSVLWNVSYPLSYSGNWAAYDLGYQQLGELNLSLTYIHVGGRITFGFGDAVYLVANGSSTFKEDTVYTITYGWPIPKPVIHWEYQVLKGENRSYVKGVGFKYHDGEIHSWEIRSYFYSPRW